MTIPVPIASMLELPELIVAGCEGGIEIVMLSSLPDEDGEGRSVDGAGSRPLLPTPDLT